MPGRIGIRRLLAWGGGLLLLAAFAWGPTANATAPYNDYTLANVSGHELDLAMVNPDLVVATWVEGNQPGQYQVCSRTVANGVLQPADNPVDQGTGARVLATNRGFFLAYASGSAVMVRQGDGFSWGPATVLRVHATDPAQNPDLAAAPDGTVYLAFRQSGGVQISVNRPADPVWTPPEFAFPLADPGDLELKKIGTQYWPRIYYGSATSIVFRQWGPSGWYEPQVVAEATDLWSFKVAARSGGRHVVAAYAWPFVVRTWTEAEDGTFQPSGELVTDMGCWVTDHWIPTYDLACDAADGAHVLRYQEAWREEAGDIWLCGAGFFWEHTNGSGWEAGDFGPLGWSSPEEVAVAAPLQGSASPAFAESQYQKVQLRIFGSVVGMPAVESSTTRLNAHPNPSAGSVTLSWASDARDLVPVEIFDAAGRLVRRLNENREVAGFATAVWDGRNTGGEDLPRGMYFARVGTRGRAAAIILVR